MLNRVQQDYYLLQKSKQKIQIHLILSFVILALMDIGLFFLFKIEFLHPIHSKIFDFLLGMSMMELCFYGLLDFGLATGNKMFRIFYWILWIMSAMFLYFPIQYGIDDLSHLILYALLLIYLLIKLYYLYRQGQYLHKNYYAKIYFDHILEVDEDQEPLIKTKQVNMPIEEEQEETIEEQEFTYPQIAYRLGICVYGSLILIPILIQIFSGFFSSLDLQKVFATKDMFVLCMASSIIWSIPIFYLYYDHPKSKKIILISFLLELCSIILYGFKLYQYYASQEFALRVFILFILVDILRYVLLFLTIRPIFQAVDDDD